MTRFKTLVDAAIRILEEEGEISVSKLAYMLDISPSKAYFILKAAAEVDERIIYKRGKAILRTDGWDEQHGNSGKHQAD